MQAPVPILICACVLKVASNIFLTGPPVLRGTPSTVDFTQTAPAAQLRLLDTTLRCNEALGRSIPPGLTSPATPDTPQMLALTSAELYICLLCKPWLPAMRPAK